jgi:hypothetical protein
MTIPATPEELAILARARDIMTDKATRPETGGGLALGVAEGLRLFLQVCHVDTSAYDKLMAEQTPPNPLLQQMNQDAEGTGVTWVAAGEPGEPPESPGEQEQGAQGIWGAGPPPPAPPLPPHLNQPLPGAPFMPKQPTPVHQPKAVELVDDLGDDPDGDIAGYDGGYTALDRSTDSYYGMGEQK